MIGSASAWGDLPDRAAVHVDVEPDLPVIEQPYDGVGAINAMRFSWIIDVGGYGAGIAQAPTGAVRLGADAKIPETTFVEASDLAFNTVPPSDIGHCEWINEHVQAEPATSYDVEPMDGARTYKVTLPKDIPAEAFRSLTIYENQTRSMLKTPQKHPRAGSQSYPSPAAKAAEDGSTTIWFSAEQPAGVDRGKWIQTDPEKGGLTILRLYSPLPSFFDKSWRSGEIELAQQAALRSGRTPAILPRPGSAGYRPNLDPAPSPCMPRRRPHPARSPSRKPRWPSWCAAPCQLHAIEGAVACGGFSCEGWRLVGCTGRFEIAGGEGRMVGVTGERTIALRRYETSLAELSSGVAEETGLGIAYWHGFTLHPAASPE